MTSIGMALLIFGASPYFVWQQIYDSGKTDMCHGVCLDSSGRVVVVGKTNQLSNYDCWTIIISDSGDSLLSFLYDNGRDETPVGIATIATQDIAIAMTSATAENQRIETILCDSTGELLWKRKQYASGTTEATAITVGLDGEIYVSGRYSISPANHFLTINGYDCEGQPVVSVNIGAINNFTGGIQVDPQGYIYLGADRRGPCALWKFSSEGDFEWQRGYNDRAARGFGLEINDADHLFQAGDLIIGIGINFDFLLLKWDTSGRLFWDPGKNYDLGADEHCCDIALDAGPAGPSDCYLAGWQARGEEEDVALVKTDSAGNMLWGWVDTLEGKQQIESIEVDSDGYIYLAGSHHNGENWDMLVMKVRQPLTITGRVTDSADASMEGITVSLTGDTTVEVLTDTGGYYGIEVYNGGSYTVSPNLHSWVFEPSSHTYTPLAHRMWDQDFENRRWTGVGEDTYIRPSPYWELISSVGPQIVLQYFNYPQGFNVSIFDASGCRVEEIHSATQSGTLIWGENQHPGVYFVQVRSGESIENMKVVLVK